jgi:hypothetical protein
MLHMTTQPSASPVTSLVFSRMKAAEWICELWPRKMYAGSAGGNAILRHRHGNYGRSRNIRVEDSLGGCGGAF